MATQLRNLYLSDFHSTVTMLDLIKGLEEAKSTNGLFIKQDRAISYSFISYNKMAAMIAVYMIYFRTINIKKGTLILFPFETNLNVIICFFALIGIGAIPLSIKPYGLGVSQNAYLTFLSKIADKYEVKFILETPSIKNIKFDFDLTKLPLSLPEEHSNSKKLEFEKIGASDIAFVQFSSGSTSFPKGIPITHEKIISQLKIIVNHFFATAKDITATWLPLYHDMGLVGSFLTPLYLKHNLHLTTPINFFTNPVKWLEYLSDYKITSTVIPDFAISYILKKFKNKEIINNSNIDLSNIRIIYNGSEPINSNNLEEFIAFFKLFGLNECAMKPCYGMAEAVLMVTCISLEQSIRTKAIQNGYKVTSVGKLMPGFEIRLKNEQGKICRKGEIGQIELKGGTLVGKYFKESNFFYNEDGFFSTGDLGFIDEEELFICGRLFDKFKINGQNYFASDFEHTIEKLSFMQPKQVAVIRPEGKVVILIEIKRNIKNLEKLELQKQVRLIILENIGVKISTQNIFLIKPGQLQRTSSGKLKRNAIARSYIEGRIELIE